MWNSQQLSLFLVFLAEVEVRWGRVGGLFLPLEVMDPAKNLLYYWAHWNLLSWEENYWEKKLGEKCDIPPRATLGYAYFKSLEVTNYRNENENNVISAINRIASRLTFYKKRLLPLPTQMREDFCAYSKGHRTVCDDRKGVCVDCSKVSVGNDDLFEACNIQEGVTDPPFLHEGETLYESIKGWLIQISQKHSKLRGDACNATGKQTLAMSKMRKFFASFLHRLPKDAESKSEWLEEWEVIRVHFNEEKLEGVKELLDGFIDEDANSVFCSPVEGDMWEEFPVGKQGDRLVCGEDGFCVWCKNDNKTELRFTSGPLKEACQELGIKM